MSCTRPRSVVSAAISNVTPDWRPATRGGAGAVMMMLQTVATSTRSSCIKSSAAYDPSVSSALRRYANQPTAIPVRNGQRWSYRCSIFDTIYVRPRWIKSIKAKVDQPLINIHLNQTKFCSGGFELINIIFENQHTYILVVCFLRTNMDRENNWIGCSILH